MPLPPTPWLNPPDYVGSYIAGAKIGAEASEARARIAAAALENQNQMAIAQARIAQQAQEAELEAQTRRDIAEREARLQQSRIDIEGQIARTKIGLDQVQLEETKRMNDLKIVDAARKYGAAASYSRRRNELIQSGMDENEATIKASLEHAADLGTSGAGVAALLRADMQRLKPTEEDKVVARQPVMAAFSNLSKLEADARAATGKKKLELEKSSVEEKRRINAEYERMNLPAPFADLPEKEIPLPSKKEDLKVGQLYQTKKGLVRWNGYTFNPVKR